MRKIKVIYLVEALHGGGLERVIATLAVTLDKTMYDVEVWCITEGGIIADELERDGITVKILGLASYFNPLNIFRLSWSLRKSRPKIVHTHGYFAGTFSRIACLIAGTPLLFHHVHSSYTSFKKRNLIIEKALSLFTEKVICCSKTVAQFVEGREKIASQKVAVVYNGISLAPNITSKNAEETKKEFLIEAGDTVIGIIASLTPNKGHAYLINAVKEITNSISFVKLLIVGDGLCRKDLMAQAELLGISDKVIFAGRRRDIYELLWIIDIVVLPSIHREGLPISIIEAMAMGKPVVASKIGGIPEVVIDGVNGLTVEPGDINILSKSIYSLLADRKKAHEMGEEGKRIYEKKFSAKIMTENIQALYAAAIRGKRL